MHLKLNILHVPITCHSVLQLTYRHLHYTPLLSLNFLTDCFIWRCCLFLLGGSSTSLGQGIIYGLLPKAVSVYFLGPGLLWADFEFDYHVGGRPTRQRGGSFDVICTQGLSYVSHSIEDIQLSDHHLLFSTIGISTQRDISASHCVRSANPFIMITGISIGKSCFSSISCLQV